MTHREVSAHALVCFHNFVLFETRPQGQTIQNEDVILFDRSDYTFLRLHGDLTPTVPFYYSSSIQRPNGAHLYLILVISYTELAILTVALFLLAATDGVLLPHRLDTALQIRLLVIFLVSVTTLRAVDKVRFLETIRDSQFDAVMASMDRQTMAALHSNEMSKFDNVPYAYSNRETLARFRFDCDLPHVVEACPARSYGVTDVVQS